ncbi:MAG: tetratricopeptide repeat protein [Candidatus Sabulitectum sp.]|nr:tetratricopeptide repeat protein [Candidatus Sabulitectum sp.]
MAENSTGLSTEQLLMELGKVVLGLGRKIETLGEKMDAIHSVLADDIASLLKNGGEEEAGEAGLIKELKPIFEGLSASFEQLPSRMTDRLKELQDENSSNPMETVEQKLTEVCGKLDGILKISEDREFVETLSTGMSQVKEQLVLSGEQVLGVVKEVPDKIEKMGEDLSEAMKALSETTGAMLDKTEQNISRSDESLGKIKKELEKGLQLNTDMTSQMVDLTTRFADKAEEDRILDLNTRAIGHFNRGEYTESETLFSQALNLSPENSELLCNTAHLKAAMEDMDEAEKLFRKALEVSPDLEPAVSGLGMLMISTGRAEETIEFLKKVLSDGDPSVRTAIAYARALAALDKHDEAVELLEASLRAAPDNHDLVEELAQYGYEGKS